MSLHTGAANQRYARVRSDESDIARSFAKTMDHAENKRRRRERIECIDTKIKALMWLVGDALMLWATDFFPTVLYDDRCSEFFLNVAFVSLGIFATLILYSAVWLKYVQGVQEEVEVVAPRVMPAATLFFVVQGFAFTIGLWPAFGLLTPVILVVNFLGFLNFFHFVPSCGGVCGARASS